VQETGANVVSFNEAGIARLDNAMREIVSDQDVGGMVWLLAKGGEMATFETAGLARTQDQAPMLSYLFYNLMSVPYSSRIASGSSQIKTTPWQTGGKPGN